MLQVIAQYAYFFLVSVFVVFLGIWYIYSDQVGFGPQMILLFTVLLIPFFDYIIEFLKREKIAQVFLHVAPKNLYKLLFFSVILIILWYIDYSLLHLYMIAFLFVSIALSLDSRVSFLVSLVLFLYIAVFLLLGNDVASEKLSIYAYYFLIIGVVVQICESVFSKQK